MVFLIHRGEKYKSVSKSSTTLTGIIYLPLWTSQVVLVVKNPTANAGDIREAGSIPGLGRSPQGGHGNPLQYSSLENCHGQRCLAGCSPRGQKELDMTGRLSTAHSYSLF